MRRQRLGQEEKDFRELIMDDVIIRASHGVFGRILRVEANFLKPNQLRLYDYDD